MNSEAEKEPEIEYHPLTKKKVSAIWRDDEGRPHRIGKPAIVRYNPVTEQEIYKEYCIHGITTRDDGPAIDFIDLENRYQELIWMKDGKKHRENAPALTHTDIVTCVEFVTDWYWEDQKHRADGVACTLRDRVSGEIFAEFPFLYGQRKTEIPSCDF